MKHTKKHSFSAINRYFHFYKYDILIVALMQHLFVGLLMKDLDFYMKYIWPLNMILLGIASIGLFNDKKLWKKVVKNTIFFIVLAFPISLEFQVEATPLFMIGLSLAYVLFFSFIFFEILRFLVEPSYINLDVITASACGFLLLVEIGTFSHQFFYYLNPKSFVGIQSTHAAEIFIDFVYLSSVTMTGIGFGDITPSEHNTRLLTSIFGISGHFYTVVLVGILISKFSSKTS